MLTHPFAIWASKNVTEGFTLQILPSPSYELTKSFESNVQNILDFKKVVGRDWKPYEGSYLCYFDRKDLNVGSIVGDLTSDGTIIWYSDVSSQIIDPSTLENTVSGVL